MYYSGHTDCAALAQKLMAMSTGPHVKAATLYLVYKATAKLLEHLKAWFPPLHLFKLKHSYLVKSVYICISIV